LTQTACLKSAAAKNGFEFLRQSQNETCESNMVLYLLFGSATQRFALPALGWAAGRRPTGKRIRR